MVGLTRGKTGSAYGKFTSANGKTFIIRVSGHNVNADNVKDVPVESIVIKTKRSRNRFFANGDKYVNEYVYFKEDIEEAPMGTLSTIAECISEMLDTGEYNDRTGLAEKHVSPDDSNLKYRDGDDLNSIIENVKANAEQFNAESKDKLSDAVKAIGGGLRAIHKAMLAQRACSEP